MVTKSQLKQEWPNFAHNVRNLFLLPHAFLIILIVSCSIVVLFSAPRQPDVPSLSVTTLPLKNLFHACFLLHFGLSWAFAGSALCGSLCANICACAAASMAFEAYRGSLFAAAFGVAAAASFALQVAGLPSRAVLGDACAGDLHVAKSFSDESPVGCSVPEQTSFHDMRIGSNDSQDTEEPRVELDRPRDLELASDKESRVDSALMHPDHHGTKKQSCCEQSGSMDENVGRRPGSEAPRVLRWIVWLHRSWYFFLAWQSPAAEGFEDIVSMYTVAFHRGALLALVAAPDWGADVIPGSRAASGLGFIIAISAASDIAMLSEACFFAVEFMVLWGMDAGSLTNPNAGEGVGHRFGIFALVASVPHKEIRRAAWLLILSVTAHWLEMMFETLVQTGGDVESRNEAFVWVIHIGGIAAFPSGLIYSSQATFARGRLLIMCTEILGFFMPVYQATQTDSRIFQICCALRAVLCVAIALSIWALPSIEPLPFTVELTSSKGPSRSMVIASSAAYAVMLCAKTWESISAAAPPFLYPPGLPMVFHYGLFLPTVLVKGVVQGSNIMLYIGKYMLATGAVVAVGLAVQRPCWIDAAWAASLVFACMVALKVEYCKEDPTACKSEEQSRRELFN